MIRPISIRAVAIVAACLLLPLSGVLGQAPGAAPKAGSPVAQDEGTPESRPTASPPPPLKLRSGVMRFGTVEYYGPYGKGVRWTSLDIARVTAEEFGGRIETCRFRDRLITNGENLLSLVERSRYEQIGDQIEFQVKPNDIRTFTLNFDGTQVTHLNEGIGPPTSTGIPTQMEDPLFLDDVTVTGYQQMFYRWMQRRSGQVTEGKHPLDGLKFSSIAPRQMQVKSYHLASAGTETLKAADGRSVETTKIEVVESPRGAAANLSTTKEFWVTKTGEIVKLVIPRQRTAPADHVTYNLDYYPNFSRTRTLTVPVPIGNNASRPLQIATSDVSDLFPGMPAGAAEPGIFLLDDGSDNKSSGWRTVHRTRWQFGNHGFRTGSTGLLPGDGEDSGPVEKVLAHFAGLPNVDGDQLTLFCFGHSLPQALDLLATRKFRGLVVVNGTAVNPDDAFRAEVKARLAGGLPVLVVYGTAGAPNEVAARSALGKLITEAGAAGQVEVVDLSAVDGDMRLVEGEPQDVEDLAPGYLRALSRWFRARGKN